MKKYNVWYCHLCERKRRFYYEPPDFYSSDGLGVTRCSQGHDCESEQYIKAERKAFDNVMKEAFLPAFSAMINNPNPLSRVLYDPKHDPEA